MFFFSAKISFSFEFSCLCPDFFSSLKEKIFSIRADDFTIVDTMGTPYFKCDAKLNSLRKKKFITDIYKKPIYTITQEVLSLRGRFKFLYGDTEKVIGSVDPIRTFGNLYSVNFFNLAITEMIILN